MSTIFTGPRSYILIGTILAMAAIIFAVALTATGPAQAQGKSEPRRGDNALEYIPPVPCSEESEPDDTTTRVITRGFYPIFEGFWDYEVGHLSNNFCPPVVTKKSGRGGTTYTRADANIHISETAFSIPTSYEATVVDSRHDISDPDHDDGPDLPAGTRTIDLAHYPFLARNGAVSPARKENGETVFPDNSTLYWVSLDDPNTPNVNETSPLQLGLSTALMDSKDWYNASGDPVQFRFSAVHVIEAGVPVETHVVGANFFAFGPRPMNGRVEEPLWSDAATDVASEIGMQTGQYRPMQFAFTKPGEYLMQVNVQGHVRNGDDEPPPRGWAPHTGPISPDRTITSPVQWYTLHVGPEADLGVTLTHNDETPGDDSTTVTDRGASFSVTATNNGPERAEGVVVEVSLPVDLNYSSPNPAPANITYQCGVISWRVGNLDPGASRPLNFNAEVSTSGPKSFTVDSVVHSSTVDDNELNDTASVEVRTNSGVVTAPFFPGVTREIVEHAVAGTHAGLPVAAMNPDGRRLYYALDGRCYNWFEAHSNGQITLAAGQKADGEKLNYDAQAEFHLTLHVSDEPITRMYGEIDLSTVDDSTPVTIKVIDTPPGTVHPSINFTFNNGIPRAGDEVRITATVTGLTPEDGTPTGCIWYDEAGHKIKEVGGHICYVDVSSETAATKEFKVHVYWNNGGMTDTTTVTWQ